MAWAGLKHFFVMNRPGPTLNLLNSNQGVLCHGLMDVMQVVRVNLKSEGSTISAWVMALIKRLASLSVPIIFMKKWARFIYILYFNQYFIVWH